MWRMKVTAVSLVVMGALLFGSAIAFAGWGWNAKVNIEGTTVSTAWSVDDKSGPTDYHASITLEVPENAVATEVKVAQKRETLNIVHVPGLACNDDGSVNVTATFNVTGEGTDMVSVSVERVKGKFPYSAASGDLGEDLVLNFTMPGTCSN